MRNTRKALSLLMALALMVSFIPTLFATAAPGDPATLVVNMADVRVMRVGTSSWTFPMAVTANIGGTVTAGQYSNTFSGGTNFNGVITGDTVTFTGDAFVEGATVMLRATPYVTWNHNGTASSAFTTYQSSGANLNPFTIQAWYDDVTGAKLGVQQIQTVTLGAGTTTVRAEFADTNMINQDRLDPPTYTTASETTARNNMNLANVAGGGVAYDPAKNIRQEILDKEIANYSNSASYTFYQDRTVGGVENTDGYAKNRGGGMYLRGSGNLGTFGFAAPYYIGTSITAPFTVTSSGDTISETNTGSRINAPSHIHQTFSVGTGVSATVDKWFTWNNCAVMAVTLNNTTSAAITKTFNVANGNANMATVPGTNDTRRGSQTYSGGGGMKETYVLTYTLKALNMQTNDTFKVSGSNLQSSITIPANGSAEFRVVCAVSSPTTPKCLEDFDFYTDLSLSNYNAVKNQIITENKWYTDEIPYVDIPNIGTKKAIESRWWLLRFNSMDINTNSYTNMFPTSNEGVHLYNNAIILTQGMHLQDMTWQRSGYNAYGNVMNAGMISYGSAFLDIQSQNSWNNHYANDVAQRGYNAYKVHGGGAGVAEAFARFFEGDATGQIEHYSRNGGGAGSGASARQPGNFLIGYSSVYMPGNDADAISFSGNGFIDRPESAYVYGAARGAAQLYAVAGNTAKAASAGTLASNIFNHINATGNTRYDAGLWCPEHQQYEALRSSGNISLNTDDHSSITAPTNSADSGKFRIPQKESNMFDVYASYAAPLVIENVALPNGTRVTQNTKNGLRLLADDRHFRLFPYYTADTFDKARYSVNGGSNYSNINSTVVSRAYLASLRYYDRDQTYVTRKMFGNEIDLMGWIIYRGTNMNSPNTSEYFSAFNPTTFAVTGANNAQDNLGNLNWLFFEGMAGIVPRLDNLIEIDPLVEGYDYFFVNNVKYHDIENMTLVWQDPVKAPGHYPLAPDGFSLYLDGQRIVTFPTLQDFIYDPDAAGNKIFAREMPATPQNEGVKGAALNVPGMDVNASANIKVATAVDTPITDERLIANMKRIGVDLEMDAPNLAISATASASYTGTRRLPTFQNYHCTISYTADANSGSNFGTSSKNTRSSTNIPEPAPVASAVNDGTASNAPFWHNRGTPNASDYVQLQWASEQEIDQLRVWYWDDHINAANYPYRFRAPAAQTVEYYEDGQWKTDAFQFSPEIPREGDNTIYIGKVVNGEIVPIVTDRIRLRVTRAASIPTTQTTYVCVSEIQAYLSDWDLGDFDPPTVSATIASGVKYNGFDYNLTSNASSPFGTVTYAWSVDPSDGVTIATPAAANSTINFANPGAYDVTLTVSDLLENEASSTIEDIVITDIADEPGPVVATCSIVSGDKFSGASEMEPPVAAPVYALTGAATSDVPGDALIYAWSATPSEGVTFSNANIASPTVRFADPGDYVLTLTVTNPRGKSAMQTIDVNAKHPSEAGPPTLSSITISTPIYTRSTYTLTSNAAPGLSGTALTYAWSVTPSEGVILSNASAASPTVSFTNVGDYAISLVVTDIFERTASYTRTDVSVTNAPASPYNVALGSSASNNLGTSFQANYANTSGSASSNYNLPIDGTTGGRAAGSCFNTWNNSAQRHWFQLTFADPVTVYAVNVAWASDGSGTNAPTAGSQVSNGTTAGYNVVRVPANLAAPIPLANETTMTTTLHSNWVDVAMTDRSGNSILQIGRSVTNGSGTPQWNFAGFNPVQTKYLLMEVNRASNGVGVNHWQAYALEPVNKTEAVNINMEKGTISLDRNNWLPGYYSYETDMRMVDFATTTADSNGLISYTNAQWIFLRGNVALNNWGTAEDTLILADNSMGRTVHTISGTNRTLGYRLDINLTVIDKGELKNDIEAFGYLIPDAYDYLPDTWATAKDAYDAAYALNELPIDDVTQDEIDEAANALSIALAGLEKVIFTLAPGQAPSFVIRKNMITQIKFDTNLDVTFTSSNPAIATVTPTGVVTGKSIGVAVIQIKDALTGRVLNVVVNCTN